MTLKFVEIFLKDAKPILRCYLIKLRVIINNFKNQLRDHEFDSFQRGQSVFYLLPGQVMSHNKSSLSQKRQCLGRQDVEQK